MDGYITKPFSISDIQRNIEDYLIHVLPDADMAATVEDKNEGQPLALDDLLIGCYEPRQQLDKIYPQWKYQYNG